MGAVSERESARARRYVLGQTSEEESTAIEREYFADETAIDWVWAAEDDLIDEYLSGRLDAVERDWFEREYLKSRLHRIRVEAARQLLRSGESGGRAPAPMARRWLAAAAVVILVAAGLLWRFAPERVVPRAVPEGQATSLPRPSPAPPSSRLFGVSISPVTVRSASDSADLVIPAGTDVLRVSLESDADQRRLTRATASVRTVSGTVAWSGPANLDDLPPGVMAQIDVPAARLPVEDYVITLVGADETGIERERARYVVRVRVR
jgi:hypothetical protein